MSQYHIRYPVHTYLTGPRSTYPPYVNYQSTGYLNYGYETWRRVPNSIPPLWNAVQTAAHQTYAQVTPASDSWVYYRTVPSTTNLSCDVSQAYAQPLIRSQYSGGQPPSYLTIRPNEIVKQIRVQKAQVYTTISNHSGAEPANAENKQKKRKRKTKTPKNVSDSPDSSASSNRSPDVKRHARDLKTFKTKLCSNKDCPDKEFCPYAHGIYELRRKVSETAQMYAEVTRLHIEESLKDSGKMRWIDNILLQHPDASFEHVMYRDKNFILLHDQKWCQNFWKRKMKCKNLCDNGRNLEGFYCLAIVNRLDLSSIRDLTAEHVPLLEHIINKSTEIIKYEYRMLQEDGIIQGKRRLNINKLKFYFHYLPSYYHLHVHILNEEYPSRYHDQAPVYLKDVIRNIKKRSDYYQTSTLDCWGIQIDPLIQKLQKFEAEFISSESKPTDEEKKKKPKKKHRNVFTASAKSIIYGRIEA